MSERISDSRLQQMIAKADKGNEQLKRMLMFGQFYEEPKRYGLDVASALRELAELREQVRWIPVTERLPEMAGEGSRFVLTTTADGGWTTVTVSSLHWIHKDASSTGEKCYLTHWREIGPPPGGEG